MSKMNHDFMLLSCTEHPIEDWGAWHHNPDAIKIQNDVLEYMADTLKWIPTYNPAKKCPHQGLCWFGPTVILQPGAEIAAKIFSNWADLFRCGPEVLELTGQFGWQVENDPDMDGVLPNTATYEHLIFNRDELVANLRTLASYAARVQQTKGAHYILHMGI
jgi:hypothetical protein